MAFKKTKSGWLYAKDGDARIPTKKNLFDNPTEYDPQTGHPLTPEGKIDWKKVFAEIERKESS